VNLDDRELVRIEAIIQSMTRFEKRRPVRAHPRARARDAHRQGLGHEARGVNELVQKFLFMKQMMGGLGQNLGMDGEDPRDEAAAMARNMKKMMAAAGCPAWAWAACPACPAWACPACPGWAGCPASLAWECPASPGWECPVCGFGGGPEARA
jgi:signal recognition particle subunit SRP54